MGRCPTRYRNELRERYNPAKESRAEIAFAVGCAESASEDSVASEGKRKIKDPKEIAQCRAEKISEKGKEGRA